MRRGRADVGEQPKEKILEAIQKLPANVTREDAIERRALLAETERNWLNWMLARALTTPRRSADLSGNAGHPGASGDPGFEERLTREIVQSERTRMLIFAGLSGALVVVFLAFVLVFREEYARMFGTV